MVEPKNLVEDKRKAEIPAITNELEHALSITHSLLDELSMKLVPVVRNEPAQDKARPGVPPASTDFGGYLSMQLEAAIRANERLADLRDRLEL